MAPTFDTAFCRLVDIPFPVVLAPIGGLATPERAAAVSEAGGLGMLALTWTEPDEIDVALARMRELTDKPYGVNLILQAARALRSATRLIRDPEG